MQDDRIVEVDGRVAGAARRIDVDDLKIFADRTRLEIILPGHRHGRDADVEQRRVRLPVPDRRRKSGDGGKAGGRTGGLSASLMKC